MLGRKNAKYIEKLYNDKGELITDEPKYIYRECVSKMKKQLYEWEDKMGYLS